MLCVEKFVWKLPLSKNSVFYKWQSVFLLQLNIFNKVIVVDVHFNYIFNKKARSDRFNGFFRNLRKCSCDLKEIYMK